MSLLEQGLELKADRLQQEELSQQQRQSSLEREVQERTQSELARRLAKQEQDFNQLVEREGKAQATQLLKTNKEWVQTEQKRLQVLQQREERSRRWRRAVASIVNTTAFFLLWGVGAAGWGWIGGINTPSAIACQSRSSLCYRMRWGVKAVVAKSPKPKCTKTRKGLKCQGKPTRKLRHKSQTRRG